MDVAALGLGARKKAPEVNAAGLQIRRPTQSLNVSVLPEGVVSLRHGVGAEGIRTFSASFMDDLVVNPRNKSVTLHWKKSKMDQSGGGVSSPDLQEQET